MVAVKAAPFQQRPGPFVAFKLMFGFLLAIGVLAFVFLVLVPWRWFLGFHDSWETTYPHRYNPKKGWDDRFAPCEVVSVMALFFAAAFLSPLAIWIVIVLAATLLIWSGHQRLAAKDLSWGLVLWQALDISCHVGDRLRRQPPKL